MAITKAQLQEKYKELEKENKALQKLIKDYLAPLFEMVAGYPPALRPVIEKKIKERIPAIKESVQRDALLEIKTLKKDLYYERVKALKELGCPERTAIDVLHFESNRAGIFNKGNPNIQESVRKYWLDKLPPRPF